MKREKEENWKLALYLLNVLHRTAIMTEVLKVTPDGKLVKYVTSGEPKVERGIMSQTTEPTQVVLEQVSGHLVLQPRVGQDKPSARQKPTILRSDGKAVVRVKAKEEKRTPSKKEDKNGTQMLGDAKLVLPHHTTYVMSGETLLLCLPRWKFLTTLSKGHSCLLTKRLRQVKFVFINVVSFESLELNLSCVSDVTNLRASEEYVDTYIVCSDGQLKAHSLVLCGMSPFLKRLIKDAWTSPADKETPWVNLELQNCYKYRALKQAKTASCRPTDPNTGRNKF